MAVRVISVSVGRTIAGVGECFEASSWLTVEFVTELGVICVDRYSSADAFWVLELTDGLWTASLLCFGEHGAYVGAWRIDDVLWSS